MTGERACAGAYFENGVVRRKVRVGNDIRQQCVVGQKVLTELLFKKVPRAEGGIHSVFFSAARAVVFVVGSSILHAYYLSTIV